MQAKAAAQDADLPHVTGEILVCIDADTVIADDVVEQFLVELEKVDATCANMLPMPQQRGFWVANRRFAYALGRFWWRWCQAEVGRLMVLSGCAYALRAETVRAIGGFPGELITCDMDLTWSLYTAGYKISFCHQALAYTYDPETFRVYTEQMKRWASGFFQNFQSHKREALRSPSALLVVGTLLLDLLMLPVVYLAALARAPARRQPPLAADVGRQHRRPLRDLHDRRHPHDQLAAGGRRLPLLLDRELVEQGDLSLDVRARVDPWPPLPVVDGPTGTRDRDLGHEPASEIRALSERSASPSRAVVPLIGKGPRRAGLSVSRTLRGGRARRSRFRRR